MHSHAAKTGIRSGKGGLAREAWEACDGDPLLALSYTLDMLAQRQAA